MNINSHVNLFIGVDMLMKFRLILQLPVVNNNRFHILPIASPNKLPMLWDHIFNYILEILHSHAHFQKS